MISNGQQLRSFIDRELQPFGYLRKKDTWYLHTPQCICFFSLAKSQFGGYYENVSGCFLKEIMEKIEVYPKYYKCHLRYNIDNLVNEKVSRQIFDLENNEFSNNEREEIISNLIQNKLLPFLKTISSKEGIKQAVVKYKGLDNYMNLELKLHLGIEIENHN